MESHETQGAEQALEKKPVRRVGTFTMGAVLVIAGMAMLLSMFFPKLDLTLMLKLSPLALISLGAETLLSARRGGKIQYDWVGMILCCLIVCTALGLFIMAWCVVHEPGWICI